LIKEILTGDSLMGMPCEVNSILKLTVMQGYPKKLERNLKYQGIKAGYRILPIDVPINLVDETWISYADVIINKLIWENKETFVEFEIYKIHQNPLNIKNV
jgi:hypothetical protein